ncbi:MAG: Crp/Fnr family transcriptional regulator [Clostridiales Family XIII bacterium]|jgi:CRP-like cAMP-binding protein|nr:Crp/Fnr family transcriptional regulator [Clostridiales Family XIII bacterium]
MSAEGYAARLAGVRVFKGLSERELKEALAYIRVREAAFEKDAALAEAGGVLHEFFCMEHGRVQGVRYHRTGACDLVQLFVPGEIIGLDITSSATRKCPYSLVALEDVKGLFVEYDSLSEKKLPPAVARKLADGVILSLATDSLRRLHKIDVLYRRHLRSRIIVYLRHLAAMRGARAFKLDMDREQLAQYLGVNRSALSHELAKMRAEGLIDFRKNRFEILSDEEL